MSAPAPPDWSGIGQRLGLADLQGFVHREVIPEIRDVPQVERGRNGRPKTRLELPLSLGFGLFIALFLSTGAFLDDTFIGVALRFLLFPVLFLGCIALMVYLFRGRFLAALMAGQTRFIARSGALTRIAGALGLTYIPAPGGAPPALKWIAGLPIAPQEIRQAAETLDAHGGMDAPLAVARRSGALADHVTVIASQETRERYLSQAAANVRVEDGFEGQRGGVPFSAFEWVESESEAPDIYHLTLVFEAPYRLQGVTQLRTRKIAWPAVPGGQALAPVRLGIPAFEERFRIRASDQVEAHMIFDPAVVERLAALAHTNPLRAVAFETHLVVDVAGEDRFNLVELTTGAWSEDQIAATLAQIADMLELADAVSRAFRLRAGAPAS